MCSDTRWLDKAVSALQECINKNQRSTAGVTEGENVKRSKSYFQVAALFHKQSDPFVTGVTETVESVEVVKPTTVLAADQAEAETILARMIPADGVGAAALADLANVQKFVKPMFR